jgi:acyl-CoA thioesterase-1
MKIVLVALGQRVSVVLLAIGLLSCGPVPASDENGQSPLIRSVGSDQIDGRAVKSLGLVVLGDSLTAGLGLAANESYPALLQYRLNAQNYQVLIVNAGVSGDTSAGGLRRLDWALDQRTSGLLIALGGNDGLRGLPVEEMKANLGEIIAIARNRNIKVLLVGMEAPPNFGEVYTSEFRDVFHELAREHAVALVPFLLDDVAGVRELNQPDGIHPNADGAARIAEHLWPAVELLVRRMVDAKGSGSHVDE